MAIATSVFIIITSIIIASFIWFSIGKEVNKLKDDKDFLELQTKNLEIIKEEFKHVNDKLNFENNQLQKNNEIITNQINDKKNHLQDLTEQIRTTLDSQTELSTKAYSNYCDILEKKYCESEKEYEEAMSKLVSNYAELQEKETLKYNEIKNKYTQELDQLKATREAVIEAARREKEIKEQTSFYCIQLSDEDLSDITKLENIKKTLHKPRVLSMLIWQTWFQKPLKSLSAHVLGTGDVTGIYKITNIITNECYIGQAVNVRERWAEHAKCGLGIDTPAGNKLYNAMKEYGLNSFSWELLETCTREQLNEKERYYINLYQSDNYGYNSNKGLTK